MLTGCHYHTDSQRLTATPNPTPGKNSTAQGTVDRSALLIPGPDDGKVALSRVKPQCYTDYICIHCTHTCMMWNGKLIAQIKHFLKDGSFAHY